MTTDPAARLAAALADRYRLERELGQGGMATVYLAHDLKHDRQVAIKVLRPELAAIIGAERFLSEIKTTANLQHPHILGLIDSGSTSQPDPEHSEGSGRSPLGHPERSEGSGRIGPDLLYYVMPYVDGESLRARLTREKQLPIADALRIAGEIASALDYAHRKGVIHRDIKPENILLHDGRALVADFGIALAASRAGGARMTETGMSLGTPSYMSPEQAMGEREITGRSDVYALGCVLYEMLVGEPPFTGPTAQAIVAKVMTAPAPSPAASRARIPPAVDAAVLTALEKLPADRFATCEEFAKALVAEAPRATTSLATRKPRALPLLAAGAAALALALALALVTWRAATRVAPVPILGRSTQLTSDPALEIQPAISSDGKFVAYSAGNSARMRIYIRPVGGGRTIPLTDDSTAVETEARWSPDGENLLFLTGGGASIAPALGGTARRVVAPGIGGVLSAAWSPTGSEVAFVRGDSLQVVPVSGSPARLLATVSEAHSCTWSPDGRWIACARFNREATIPGVNFGNLAPGTIVLVPAEGGTPVEPFTPVASSASPVWSPEGRRLYFVSNRDGPRDVYAISLGSSGKVRGQPARVTTGLGATSVSLSGDGRRLAYAVYSARANIWSVPIPSSGSVSAESATPVTTGNQVIEAIRVSSDGRWLLYDSNLQGNSDIFRLPIGDGPSEQLTTDPVDEFAADLSPDGRTLAYHTWRTGTRDIEVKPLDGAPTVLVTDTPMQEAYPVWSPDGRSLLFVTQSPPAYSIHVARRGADGRWARAQLADSALSPEWSPDGASVAFVAAVSTEETHEIRIIPAAGGPERPVFAMNVDAPVAQAVRWSPDGRQLYFKSHDAAGRTSLWGVSSTGGTPRLLVRFPNLERQSSRFDFAVDATRFYFTIEDRQSDIAVAELLAR
jgi:serine/threonine-protein kinase